MALEDAPAYTKYLPLRIPGKLSSYCSGFCINYVSHNYFSSFFRHANRARAGA